MSLGNLIYDTVLYNYNIKNMATIALRSHVVTDNFIYKKFYGKLLKTKMQRFSKIPLRVMIENTNLCNAGCIFCPHKNMKRQTGYMDLLLTKKIIDECTKLRINYVTIYGFGEPLLDNFFFDRVKYAKDKGIERVTTNTNAAFLSEEKARQLLDCGIDEVYISCDAATAETYKKIRPNLSFHKVDENILRLLNLKKKYKIESLGKKKIQKPEIILSFVENKYNTHEVQQFINKWKGKVDNISISLIHNWTGYIVSEWEKNNNTKRDPCRLLWTDMVISWNGDVSLCCNDYENRIVLGNIKKEMIEDIWSGEILKEIREYHKKKEFDKIPICSKCEYNYHYKSPWWVNK